MINPDKQKFLNIRQIGKGGINNEDDPQDIADIELVDAQNMIFDTAAEVRPGSRLKWAKPEDEENDLLCLFDAHTSDGLQFEVAVYAPNFYVRDEENDQWIKINQTYTPPVENIALMYSYINWNAGRSADFLYACNGTDSFIKWPICLSTLASGTTPADTTVTLTDGSYFPSTGTLVIQESGGVAYTMPYTSRTGNVITLTGTAGQTIGAGAGVVCEIQEMASMPKGKVLTRHQRRLFVMNYYGGEANYKYSNTDLPEDFSTGTGVTKGGAGTLADGNGGINLAVDFGQYLIIAKEDNIIHFEFSYNADLDAKLDTIYPLISDKSIGPVNVWSTIKKNKTLYYPTDTEGILEFSPIATGNSTSLGVEVKSKKIQPLYKSLNFDNARTTTYLNKVFWSCASNTINDTVLIHDTLRGYWTKFNNWNVKDWSLHYSELLFGSRTDGNIYQAFAEDLFVDNGNPYNAYLLSKDHDFGEASLPKTEMYLFVQGYIAPATQLFFDVTMIKGNQTIISTYLIEGSGRFVAQNLPEALAMTMLGLPIMGMGSSLDLASGGRGIYRAYLALPIRHGFYTISYKAYSRRAGDNWALTGVAFNPELVTQVPAEMVLGVITDPTNNPTDKGLWSIYSLPWEANVPWQTPTGGPVV